MSEPSRDIPRPPKIPREETPTASESENADSEESDSKLRYTADMTEDASDKITALKVEKMLCGKTTVWEGKRHRLVPVDKKQDNESNWTVVNDSKKAVGRASSSNDDGAVAKLQQEVEDLRRQMSKAFSAFRSHVFGLRPPAAGQHRSIAASNAFVNSHLFRVFHEATIH